jgi:hypothetical protein
MIEDQIAGHTTTLLWSYEVLTLRSLGEEGSSAQIAFPGSFLWRAAFNSWLWFKISFHNFFQDLPHILAQQEIEQLGRYVRERLLVRQHAFFAQVGAGLALSDNKIFATIL